MKLVIQKCLSASCKVDNEIISSVNSGYMILVGVTHTDTTTKAKYLAEKVAKLRIFPDSEGKLNQNIIDNNGEITKAQALNYIKDLIAAIKADPKAEVYEKVVYDVIKAIR